ncbi:MAG TPA: HAD-IA family hydrolase [Thermoanaerobacterales bacterium]|nr:HAD-IA family hydrolase [Thermoanaerobacterales bacterium]
MNIKTVIFDLDGTLIDSRKDIAVAANKTLSELNLPTLPEETIASFIGGGVDILVKRCLGEQYIHMFDEVLQSYKKNYFQGCTVYTTLYPGVKEVLEFLKKRGIKTALATNKVISLSEKILEHLGVKDYFDLMLGPEHVKNRKPNPEIINILLEKLNKKPEDTLYVGDSNLDVLCGKNAGTYTCAVTYGIGSLESIIEADPDFIITDIKKLILLLS